MQVLHDKNDTFYIEYSQLNGTLLILLTDKWHFIHVTYCIYWQMVFYSLYSLINDTSQILLNEFTDKWCGDWGWSLLIEP